MEVYYNQPLFASGQISSQWTSRNIYVLGPRFKTGAAENADVTGAFAVYIHTVEGRWRWPAICTNFPFLNKAACDWDYPNSNPFTIVLYSFIPRFVDKEICSLHQTAVCRDAVATLY